MHKVVQEDMKWLIGSGLPLKRLEGKTLLIAGANSFLASYMAQAVLFYNNTVKKPCAVIALVRNKAKAKKRYAEYLKRKDFKLLAGDVCALKKYKGKADFIIHAASQASPKFYASDPVGTMMPNITGTQNLLEIAKKKKTKAMLFLSSSEVYGAAAAGEKLLAEKSFGYLDCLTLRACYAEGKRAGETLCRIYAEKYGVKVKVARPFHTYGPNMPKDDGRVYADFVQNAVKKENIILNSDGSAVRAFCYIRDAVHGFFKVLFDGKPGEAYNIASDRDVLSVKELAWLIAGLFPERKVSVVINAAIKDKNYIKSVVAACVPDISKARALGFLPVVRAKEGFKRTIESYL